MDPDANRAEASKSEPGWDPYIVSAVCETKQGEDYPSENIRVVIDEMNATAVCRRAELLKSNGQT